MRDSWLASLSALAFGQRYAEWSGTTLPALVERNRLPFVCHCGEDGCEGFAMYVLELARWEVTVRGRLVDVCGWLDG